MRASAKVGLQALRILAIAVGWAVFAVGFPFRLAWFLLEFVTLGFDYAVGRCARLAGWCRRRLAR